MGFRFNAKFYSLVFLLVFLAVQVLLVLHTAEHGHLEHTHLGQECEQCLFAKHFDVDVPNVFSFKVAVFESEVSQAFLQQVLVLQERARSNLVRAPPFIVLS